MTRRTAILAQFLLVLALVAAPRGGRLWAQAPPCQIRDFTASNGGSEAAMRSNVTTEVLLRYHGAKPCRADGFPQLRLAQNPNTTFIVDRDGHVTESNFPPGKLLNTAPFPPFLLLKKNHVFAMTYPLATPRGSFGKTYIVQPHTTLAFNLGTPERPCDAKECGPEDCEPVDIVLIGPFQQVHEDPKADSLGNHANDYSELSDKDLDTGNHILLKHFDAQTCGGASVTSLYRP